MSWCICADPWQPNMFLWIELGGILGPIGQNLHTTSCERCFGRWCLQQRLSIQQHLERSPVWETLLKKRHHPFLDINCPLFSCPGLGHQELQRFSIGSSHTKDPLLFCGLVILPREPSLRSLECSLLPLLCIHDGRASPQPHEPWLQFLGIPCEFLHQQMFKESKKHLCP